MYELVDTDDTANIIGEYETLDEARQSKEMYQLENPANHYTIFRVTRVVVE